MKRGPSPPALIRVFDAGVTSLRGTERRKMFGYPAIFVNGNMFAGLVGDRMIVRLGETDRAKFLAVCGAEPFVAMSRVMKQWVVVPSAMLKSSVTLKAWLKHALAHGRSLPPKRRRKRTA